MNEGKVGGGGGGGGNQRDRDEDNENGNGRGWTWEYPWAKEVSHFSLYMALEQLKIALNLCFETNCEMVCSFSLTLLALRQEK